MDKAMTQLDQRAIEKVSGPSWEGLREQFFEVSEAILGVSPNCSSELTTIYVKYRTGPPGDGGVHAVAWLKRSSELVVGFALPGGFVEPKLTGAPPGMKYPGITGYLRIARGNEVPPEVGEWARLAYENVARQ